MIDTRAFREVTRSVSVSYPIPFLFTALLAFSLAAFAGALLTAGLLRWLFSGAAGITLFFALAIASYAVFLRPDLLRSERFTLLNRYFEVIGDSTMTPAAREHIGQLLATLDDETRKDPTDKPPASADEQEERDSDG